MSATVDRLVAARDLVARPGGWTQGDLARADDASAVSYDSAFAKQFCLYGACFRSGVQTIWHPEFDLLVKATGVPATRLDHWNDAPGRTQADVVAAFDRAIELARAAS